MSNTALLIIDMQVGNFLEPDPIYKGNELLAKVKSLIAKARSAQTPIVYVQNNGGSGDPDAYGTPGWEIHPSVTPFGGDVVVQKQTRTPFMKRTCAVNWSLRESRNWSWQAYKRSIA